MPYDIFCNPLDQFDIVVALTRTCRQIYDEARLLPYAYLGFISLDNTTRACWIQLLNAEMREVVLSALTEGQKECVEKEEERLGIKG